MIKNVAGQTIGGELVKASDGSAFSGVVTVYVTGDGGVQAIGSVGGGICTLEGNGYYTYAPSQAETNYDLVAFTFIGTGAIPATVQVYTTTNPSDVVVGSSISLGPTVRSIIEDALIEIGYLRAGDTADAAAAQLGLRRFQNQLEAWMADRLTLGLQIRTQFTLPSGSTAVTLGTSSADVTMIRPVFLTAVTYVIPGSSPAVEVPIGIMDNDAFAAISIKALPSALPLQCFYQNSTTSTLGTLTFWPQVTQDVTITLYSLQAVGIPAALASIVVGPPGYQDAFMYQLALRLCTPFGVQVPALLPELATRAFANMKRPNVYPGILGVDAALVPNSGAGYNACSDTTSSR